MSHLKNLLAQAKTRDPQLGADLERECNALLEKTRFGLQFERHRPEAVELPNRMPRKGDKVRVLPERGSTQRTDPALWVVKRIVKDGASKRAEIELIETPPASSVQRPASSVQRPASSVQRESVNLDDLIVVAEFRDTIYPGLKRTGHVSRGGDKPCHTVINGENYHVLNALTWTHRGKVDAIYIDPPYNTGAKDWKYNNDYVEGDDLYRHSKWLAMMERRLKVAKELLNPADSVLIVTIDEKEYLRLGLLLEQVFPEARIQMVSSQINPAVVAKANGFGRADEYLYFVMFGSAGPQRVALDREWVSAKGRTHTGKIRWDLLRRSGTNTERSHSPGCFYPIYVEPSTNKVIEIGSSLPEGVSSAPEKGELVAVLPIRQDGSEGNWQWSPQTFWDRHKQGRVKIGGNINRGFTVYILKPGEYQKIQSGEFIEIGRDDDGSLLVSDNDPTVVTAIPGTQWKVAAHDATQYGSRLLANFLTDRKFPFPKSLYAVEDALRFFITNKPNAVILDFFSGSGTTAHAVMRLNKQDGGNRQCISVTNNEVGADEQKKLRERGLRPGDAEWEQWGICDYITKPRVQAAITGQTPDGNPIKGDYKFTDEFPMADGFTENATFFTLTYEAPLAVRYQTAFAHIAPLLWLRAGSRGRCIEKLPADGWDVAEAYGLLIDLDFATDFLKAVRKAKDLRIAYIVTDDERRFQTLARRLPDGVDAVRLYESYLSNFGFANGDDA